MSKEWLEEISKNATGIINMDSGTVDSIDLSIIDFTRLIQFAKEQTKRVQELEDRISELQHQNSQYHRGLAKIRYKALQYRSDGNRFYPETIIRMAERALEGE